MEEFSHNRTTTGTRIQTHKTKDCSTGQVELSKGHNTMRDITEYAVGIQGSLLSGQAGKNRVYVSLCSLREKITKSQKRKNCSVQERDRKYLMLMSCYRYMHLKRSLEKKMGHRSRYFTDIIK